MDDVFYLESTTSSFVTVAWFGEEDAGNKTIASKLKLSGVKFDNTIVK